MSYENRQSLLLWMLLFLGSVSVFAQYAVKGRITDAKTGEPFNWCECCFERFI